MTGYQSKKAMAKGTKTVRVETLIVQDLEVPVEWDREEVYDFLGEHQSFRTAFQGVSNEDQTARIVDVGVLTEEVIEMGDEAYDD